MKYALIPAVALITAACGGEQDVPVVNNAASNAQSQVTGPIRTANEAAGDTLANMTDHSAHAVPTVQPPAPSTPAKTDEGYRAIGTEPFWAVTVTGSSATLTRPDKPPVRFAVTRKADGRSIRYLGDGFTMTISEGPCSDGMSDTIFSDKVSLAFGEGTLKGCGGTREELGPN